jgi:anti-sigma factor RsiW
MTQMEDIHLLIQALVDGELDAATALDVERRIAADPALARHHESMAAVKKAVENLPRPQVSDEFSARIAALAGPQPQAKPDPAAGRLPPRDWRALAASILVTALVASGATYLVTAPSPDAELALSIAGDHRRSLLAQSPVDIASSDRHTVKPWLDAHVGLSPPAVDMADKGFTLIGGRVEVVETRAVPSLVYRHNEHLITLVAIPLSSSRSEAPVHLASGGFGMIRWSGQGFSFWAISDMERAELDLFVAEFRTRVAQQ